MAFNPLDYLKDLVPKNTNIFGASPNANMEKMAKMGLLGDANYEDMLAKANKQSIFQGLLSSGLAYAAQPKNQGYGSVLPYLAKAGLAGVQAAQSPYDQMGQDAMMNQQLKEMKRAKDLQSKQDLFRKNYPLTGGTTQIDPNQQVPLAPFQTRTLQDNTIGSALMGGSGYNTNAQPTAVAPMYDVVNANPMDALNLGVSQNQLKTTEIAPNSALNNLEKAYKAEMLNYSDFLTQKDKLTNKGGLNISKLNPKDFTQESWKNYVATADTTVLDATTDKVKSELFAHNAKIEETRTNILQNFGEDALNQFDQRTKNNNFNTTNASPDIGVTKVPTKVPTPPEFNGKTREAEIGFIKGNNNIPNHPNNVRLGNGDIITPTIYKTNIGAKQKAEMTSEVNKIASQNIANLENIRKQRDAISSFVNEGGASEVTGFFDVNTIAMTGGKKANARAKLETINQKEFLNNYSAVKATGGGFGALSEREGERLERMGYNLTTEQSEEQLIQNLIKMDNDLARAEQRLMDGYSKEYGAMEGYVQYELSPISSNFMPKGSNQITVKRIKEYGND
tara:strand:+ start:535 stop:2223 length:1689 start_codon:yes stop_codon:yes gene_type:complete